jgi:hypothetical protein
MQGERSERTGTLPFNGSCRAVDGFNVTTKSVRANEDKKTVGLRKILERDPKGADLKWSLFVAACRSYRYDSCLKPFPPHFVNNGLKDIEYLVCKNYILYL